MKKISLKKIVCILWILPALTQAAQQQNLSGNVDNNIAVLKNFSLIQTTNNQQSLARGVRLAADYSNHNNTTNTLKVANGFVSGRGESVVRYDQYYKKIPVWGMQVIYNISAQSNTSVSGSVVNGIEQDVPDVDNSIPLEQVKKIALGKNIPTAGLNIEKIIYFDASVSSKATLAYLVSYSTRIHEKLTLMTYCIDANTGTVLKEWDALATGSTY